MSVLRFKDPATNEWKEITTIMGPAGPQGPKGEDGGIKFEELTDAQKEELRGPQGAPGPTGPQGEQGPIGPAGQDYVLTEEDKQEIAGMVEVSGGEEVAIDNKTIIKDDNGAIKTSAYIKGGTGKYSAVIGVGLGADGSATAESSVAICGGSSSANGSVAIGTRSNTSQTHSFALGYYAYATGQKQTVIGNHNIADTTSSFILGSGTGSNAKRNAMTVDANNQVHFPGTVVIGENKIEIATKDDILTEAQINTLITTALGNIGVAEEGAY